MSSYITSFVGLFAHHADDVPSVESIEIPLIQRDYAQGRTDEWVTRIRENFLDALRSATTGVEPLCLDFVYGDVSDATLRPLDGQQRLTTLFLLHWYVASRTGHLDDTERWTQFAYATRPSARRFCERLVQHALPAGDTPSAWIIDQPWYLYVWRHDPTVQSMLVMLDAIHCRFADDDLVATWSRLVDPDEPAISFHLLPVDDMGSAEDLYIKMNSRGKPLTEFETFKAELERELHDSPHADEFARRVDGRWADVMWPLRGKDNVVDEEFLNYTRFVVELCEWRQGTAAIPAGGDVKRAEGVFGPGRPGASENLDFLFNAFDAWVREDTGGVEDTDGLFARLLTTTSTRSGVEQGKITVFGDIGNHINLFEACCRTRNLGNRRSLFLYAVLLHRIHRTDGFARRLRVLRNLIEASTNEIRLHAMPKLIADVKRIIVDDDLDAVEAFNTEQQRDEVLKRDFVVRHPELEWELFHLEDHEILRGCLMAFELDAEVFEQRADAFRRVVGDASRMLDLTGALLAIGDYSRALAAGKHRFGSPTQPSRWRDLLAGDAPSRADLGAVRVALGRLLDLLAMSDTPLGEQVLEIQHDWLRGRETDRYFDWRYYLVKYPAMREGASGIYATPGGERGFSFCMLEGTALNGYYRDPFLLAVARKSEAQEAVYGSIGYRPDGPWFTGPAAMPRWMRLQASGVQMTCVTDGFLVLPPADGEFGEIFDRVRIGHDLVAREGGYLLEVCHGVVESARFDTSDRVELGAALLSDLVGAGL